MRGHFFKIFILFFSSTAMAQVSVGLRESALGNSGVAITESSAPSYYNPALLAERQKNYFSLTGTSLTNFKSTHGQEDFNSTKLSPNYLSSIQAFENYVHEFSLVNQFSADSRSSAPVTNGTKTTHLRTDQYTLNYSFAFKNFPFGFQTGLRMNEQHITFNQTTDDGNIATGTNLDLSTRIAHLYLGFGGLHQLGSHYRFGYKYETQGLKIFRQKEQTSSYYYYDRGGNLFTTGQIQSTTEESENYSQAATLGHSFTAGDHEFLTDSRFFEKTDTKNSFGYYQTFGYKINFDNKMQFMTGISHEFDSKSNYYSAGYSWLTNTLRSTVSGYYAKQEGETELAGLTFGSEFVY